MRIIPFLFIFCLLFGCGPGKQKEESVNDTKSDPVETAINYSQNFSISNYNGYKILSVQKNGSKQKYVLYKKGTQKPEINDSRAIFVQTPVTKAACLSSLYVGFLDRLNETEKIIAIDNIDYIKNKTINEKVAAGKVAQLAIVGKMNEEMTLAIKPELVINYGSGNIQSDRNEKLYNAGIPIVYCFDHFENTPLGRAEWIKFIACFFEKERAADSLFSQTEANYIALKAEAAKATEKPTVLTELKLNDAWYVPGGKSFMSILIQDANAHYCWEKDTAIGSLPLSFEQVYKVASGSDYWLNVLYTKSKKDLLQLDKRYGDFNAFKQDALYNNDLQMTEKGGNAYWETGLICPDLILLDLIKIFHPNLYKEKQFTYYRKLE
ncbi:MAG: ABC transporter substrate-binding protein [Bacteroidota bacterium]|nr:ABC transporter substrate-binding protein [Bacteroidota bacterium]